MSRDEIISANPIADFVRNRGHELKKAGENFVTNGCPVTQHKRGHRPMMIYLKTQSWNCHDCKVGGSVIDWIMCEKNVTARDAMRELGGGNNGSEIVATYDYTDEAGKLLFQCVRFDPKKFKQRREAKQDDPPEKVCDGWVWKIDGVRRVLYHLPEVIAAQTVCVSEGEKDSDNLRSLGFTATTNPMGAGKWLDEYSETLRGKDVVVFGDVGDEDKAGEKHTAHVIQSLNGVAKSIKHITLPNRFHDVSDYIASLKRDEAAGVISQLIHNTALLTPLKKSEPDATTKPLQGSTIKLPDVELWPEPVNGAEVLDAVAKCCARYVWLPDGQPAADACSLWTAHTHCYEIFQCSPRLNISSPEPRSGKTTLRDAVGLFVPRPVSTENMSTAVLFRMVASLKPIVLADEYDRWLSKNEELVGLLNAGHRKGAMVYRCEGDKNELRGFPAYSPAVLCGLGSLPGTLYDRSIRMPLKRAKKGEVQAEFDQENIELEKELCRKLARWISDNQGKIKTCNPRLPEGAYNRLKDNWRPLFKIAEVAGGDWPKRCTEAFSKLTSSDELDAQSIGVMLLADIAVIFTTKDTDRLPSAKLAESLAAIEGRQWAEWGKHRKPISTNQLANQLRPFGIKPDTIRIGDETPRGYLLDWFKEAFSRYLPQTPFSDRNSATFIGKTPVSEVQHANPMLHPEKGHFTRESCGVAPCTGGIGLNEDVSGEGIVALGQEIERRLGYMPIDQLLNEVRAVFPNATEIA